MGITEIKKRATAAARDTADPQIALLANAVIGLCDLVEDKPLDLQRLEVEERFGKSS